MSGSGNVDGGLTYRLEVKDNIVKSAKQGKAAQQGLQAQVKSTTVTMQQQTLEFISNVMAITALEGGINALAEAFTKLGIGSEKFTEGMRKAAAATKLFTGTAQLIQGLIGVMRMLTKAEIGLAVVESYRKVLHNPYMMTAVIGGAAGAGAVGGYLAGKSGGGGNTNNQVTFNFNAPVGNADRRAVERETIVFMGG